MVGHSQQSDSEHHLEKMFDAIAERADGEPWLFLGSCGDAGSIPSKAEAALQSMLVSGITHVVNVASTGEVGVGEAPPGFPDRFEYW